MPCGESVPGDRLTYRPRMDGLTERLWNALGGDVRSMPEVRGSGPDVVLPSRFDVTGLAAGAIAVATAAAAQLHALRRGEQVRPARVDRRQASAAFVSQALLRPEGWALPQAWDAVAGDYQAADGWIRLHTNYRHHREALERVLGPTADKAAAERATARWSAADLEAAVVAAGGAAAAMHSREGWLSTAAGAATASEPILRVTDRPAQILRPIPRPAVDDPRPFDGIRVLDLTRVIAGPVCTRFLAAYGADVVRIDPRGFEEVPALVPETTIGKRCAMLDLRAAGDRTAFEALARTAHVIVSGLRPGALRDLGYGPEQLRELNPDLIAVSLDAYGWDGPWRERRGFDSLVQMSSGIAATEGEGAPDPLPAQALDHATGYLLAAAVGRALSELITAGRASDIRGSLIGTANLLLRLPTPEAATAPKPRWSGEDVVPSSTFWGPAWRVPTPGHIEGITARYDVDAGPLGRHDPQWASPG